MTSPLESILLHPSMKPGYHIRIVLNHPSSSNQATNSFIPATLFQPLPSHSPQSTLRRNTHSHPEVPTTDYRQGPISVDWMDFDHMGSVTHSGKDKDRGRGNEISLHVSLAFLTDMNCPLLRTCSSHFRPPHSQEIRNYQPFRGHRSCFPRWFQQTHSRRARSQSCRDVTYTCHR